MIDQVLNFIMTRKEGRYCFQAEIAKNLNITPEATRKYLDDLTAQGFIIHSHGRHIGPRHAWYWGHRKDQNKENIEMAQPRALPLKFGREYEQAIHDRMFSGMKIAMLARQP